MADRYFPNEMPELLAESESSAASASSSLSKLLYLPYPKIEDKFLRAALQLKEKVITSLSRAFPQTPRLRLSISQNLTDF